MTSCRPVWLGLRGCLVGCLLANPACSNRHPQIPEELLGVWVSNAPAYTERSFTIRRDSILFHTGEEGTAKGQIIGLKSEWDAAKQATLYTIEYKAPGSELAFAFHYFERAKPSIRLKNRPEIEWIPASSISGRSPVLP